MERLGKNNGRYHGEAIDIENLQGEIERLAEDSGWARDTFLDAPGMALHAYRRHVPSPRKRLYLSAGIHGDEPGGPLALRELFASNTWPPDVDIWLVPCLNPTGFRLNMRENAAGIDLNRDYRQPQALEVRSHIEWLRNQPDFDLTVILHEDWEANGFYVYELNPDGLPSLAEPLIETVREECLIETSPLVDSWECVSGIIRPQVHPNDRPQWAEALYLIMHKSRQSYTLETPSDYPLQLRVRTHVRAVRTILEKLL